MITEKGYAKINLCLDVLRRRPDGYHDVSMIMQSIGIFDTVSVKLIPGDEIRLRTNSGELSAGPDNLICKAADRFKKRYNLRGGLDITLDKQIPIAAGLAGGSTDAAATLRALNRLFDIKASMQELCKIGVEIGADVPFCIMGGTMLSEGIGELLTPIRSGLKCACVLVKPDFNISTKYVYENLVLAGEGVHPDVYASVKAVEAGNLNELAQKAGNILESVTCRENPEIEEIKASMKEHGAVMSLMSGSGPSVFGLFDNESSAIETYRLFKASCYADRTFICKIGY